MIAYEMSLYYPLANVAGFNIEAMILPFIALVLSIVTLTIGANWLVEGSAKLAYRLGIPKIVVGATIVSLGTTSPEAGVSVVAALKGHSGLALGNAIGSVICDTGLIFGLGCIIGRLPIDRFILNRHGWIQFFSGLLLASISYFLVYVLGVPIIPRFVGIVFLVLLAGYMAVSVKWAKAHPNLADEVGDADKPVWLCLIMLIIGLSVVIKSSDWLVESGQEICIILKVPESVIAVTGIALGTSLPELATALTSIKQGHPEILIGNVVGADVLNILFVTGASATAIALPIPPEVLKFHLPTMLLILIVFRILIAFNREYFSRLSGVPLLAIYIIFLVVVFR